MISEYLVLYTQNSDQDIKILPLLDKHNMKLIFALWHALFAEVFKKNQYYEIHEIKLC